VGWAIDSCCDRSLSDSIHAKNLVVYTPNIHLGRIDVDLPPKDAVAEA